MLQKQRGASMWQWLIVGGMSGLLLYTVIILTPIYLETMGVKKALASLENAGVERSKTEIKKKLRANFQIDQVKRVDEKDIEFKQLRNGKLEVAINYSAKVHMAGNLYLLVEFRESVEI